MKNKTVKRRKNESDVELLERAAAVAEKVNGSLDAGNGTICPTCAPFACAPLDVVEILNYQHCYNCTYGDFGPVRARN